MDSEALLRAGLVFRQSVLQNTRHLHRSRPVPKIIRYQDLPPSNTENVAKETDLFSVDRLVSDIYLIRVVPLTGFHLGQQVKVIIDEIYYNK